MFMANIKALADIIMRLGPIAINVTQLIQKWKKREVPALGAIPAPEDLPARIERLEKNLELQSKLNEEFLSEMKTLKPALERIQKAMTILFVLGLGTFSVFVAAMFLVFLK